MNPCHVCGDVAVHSDAALCLTCSGRADRGELWYDPQWGWMMTLAANIEMLAARAAAPEVALPDGSELGRSTAREGSGRDLR